MLVLTQKVGQRIFVADGEIVLELLEIRGGHIRIGISADKDIPIQREVVFLKEHPEYQANS